MEVVKNKTNKTVLVIILILMVVTGFIIYFMYLKPEAFRSHNSNSKNNTIEHFTALTKTYTPFALTDTDIPTWEVPAGIKTITFTLIGGDSFNGTKGYQVTKTITSGFTAKIATTPGTKYSFYVGSNGTSATAGGKSGDGTKTTLNGTAGGGGASAIYDTSTTPPTLIMLAAGGGTSGGGLGITGVTSGILGSTVVPTPALASSPSITVTYDTDVSEDTTTTSSATTTTSSGTTTTSSGTTTTSSSTTTTSGTTTTPAITYGPCPTPSAAPPASIISRYFGVGFNIYPVTSTSSATQYFLVEYIPTVYNGTLGSMYAVSADGLLTIKVRNDADPSQWWTITKMPDDSRGSYYIVQPNMPNTTTKFALQYENGNLAIRPYNSTGLGYEGQKFNTSTSVITRGIPVLNNSPASLFTPEFDPYSSSSSYTSNSLTEQNSQQVSDVINAVKSSIQQYLSQMGQSQPSGQISSSSLGNKDLPLNINLKLSGNQGGVSGFANVDGSTPDSDILSILDKYEKNAINNSDSQSYYTQSDLQNQLTSSQGCKLFNINDYTSNRVSTCNCKL